MSNEFLNPRRRTSRYVAVTAVGLAALTGLTYVVASAMSGTHASADSPSTHANAGPTTTAATAVAPAGPGSAAPVTLTPGGQLVGGVSVGYPHTLAGAVSAASEYMTDLGSTLDPDRTAAVMRLVADPSYTDGPAEWAKGTSDARASLGLPTSGLLPSAAAVMLGPAEYQVRDASADQVTVLLLARYTISLPGTGTKSSNAVFPLRMHWAGGDWKVLKPDGATYTSLAAAPGSDQASSLGWQELAQ
ncbi:hypothetical protein Caci_8938 [Catenulispora acidiphila DSM 44928]|uniref:DUF8175 domain-containing protein n=1 Tax=Catenulispora acidiphila (strain DSM 44928 / JCM 14897 / NBRC 102108 / NRRL B-24433 / ID139908) TaxID=479433 RepID=C7Q3Z3_CATAD|nr:lipase chaperone [Catenulispora acidiphila]ACU77751.1 hypothetical protein Caci_8938 [Catenulispora acidiphila DSM 44928]